MHNNSRRWRGHIWRNATHQQSCIHGKYLITYEREEAENPFNCKRHWSQSYFSGNIFQQVSSELLSFKNILEAFVVPLHHRWPGVNYTLSANGWRGDWGVKRFKGYDSSCLPAWAIWCQVGHWLLWIHSRHAQASCFWCVFYDQIAVKFSVGWWSPTKSILFLMKQGVITVI